jgi:hypothetical protein
MEMRKIIIIIITIIIKSKVQMYLFKNKIKRKLA